MSWLFTSGDQRIGASALVLPMNIQDWFPLALTALISLQSKGFSRVFPNTTVQNNQFFSAQLSLWSNSPMHTWWLLGKLSFDIWTFVGKVMSLPFNTLSRWIIAFLPRSKRLSLSWLQSLSAVVLEPKKESLTLLPLFPHLFPMKWWDQMPSCEQFPFHMTCCCKTFFLLAGDSKGLTDTLSQEFWTGILRQPVCLSSSWTLGLLR